MAVKIHALFPFGVYKPLVLHIINTTLKLCDLLSSLNMIRCVYEYFGFLLQNLSIRSESVLYVYPIESNKTSVYYSMQFLKVHLPNVVIKVDPCIIIFIMSA